MPLVDLHTHTTASDGSLTPRELVALAKEEGLAAVAITDHDTVDGLPEALAAGRELDFPVIPGVEISAQSPEGGSLHLVGLFLQPDHPALLEALATLQAARAERNPKILAKFQALGLPLTWEEVTAQAAGGLVGRPHFARALVARGWVSNLGEAFGRYLGYGKRAYVPKFRFDPARSLALLRAAGAVPVLAHPGLLKMPPAALEALLWELKGQGLAGLEVFYSEHNPAEERRFLSLAGRLGLAPSGGSDFHGGNKQGIRLGRGRGNLKVDAGVLAGLRARIPGGNGA
ncbi:MAG: PHP domain-containing protein [Deltaproteobacteria bacterium]|nr:PHP domain-containing protein [Deltaproteobacteria bacterium]